MMKKLKMTTISAVIIPALSFASLSAEASICPTKPVIQDGCTFPADNPVEKVFRAAAKPFRSLWKSQCNTHDVNYQILGKTKQSSDSKLYEDMRRRCDSKFNKYLLAPANQVCRAAAYSVYVALKNTDSSQYYKPRQRDRQRHTNEYVRTISNGFGHCDMTPEYAGFYDPSLLSYINSRFQSLAGRKPTAYERFELLNLYSVDSSLNTWKSRVSSEINNNLKFNSGPEVRVVSRNNPETFKQDASSSLRARSYQWDLNIGNSNSSVFSKTYMNMYDATHRISGTLKVTDSNGNKDVKIINTTFRSKGLCAPNENLHCL
ncbi:hypothetical protein [Pseudoalteromonas phenolica]|nr:hypothetical protein [Pseudoalteromonas phenolica]